MNNAYKEKPMVPYVKTTVAMVDVNLYIKTLAVPDEVKIATYIIFRNESGNGQHGINNNYIGAQADGNRWDEKWTPKIVGIVEQVENRGQDRLFCAFNHWTTSIDMLAADVQSRGIYVGGTTHYITQTEIKDEYDLAAAYYREWVTGRGLAEPTQEFVDNFDSMYEQGYREFVAA